MATLKSPSAPKRIILALACLLGVAMCVNGIVMLADPFTWYLRVPGFERTGPFNQHFIRDIGILYLFIGGAFVAGALQPQLRVAM